MIINLPKFIDIELNTSCNLTCEQCPYKEFHKKPEFMKLYVLDDILNQIDWDCSIKLCQRGEPLLSSILIEAIKRIKRKGLRVVINTNGFYLDHMGKDLIKAGLDELYLSDYNYPKQYQNGVMFNALLQMFNSKMKFIVKTNDHKKWEGIAHEIISPVYYNHLDDTDDPTLLPDWKCSQLFERLIIDPDGSVRCCCGAITPEKYVGSIKNTTLKKIWYSPTMFILRKWHVMGVYHRIEMCRKCDVRRSFIKK